MTRKNVVGWRKSSRSGGVNDQACVEVALQWRRSSRSDGVDDKYCVEAALVTSPGDGRKA
ncbi:DUF397 domain-containing protein [Actinoallomurus acanthiterrae]